jgi:hypothetical protein
MHFTRTKSTANLKMIDNLIISPDTSTAYGQLCWLTGLTESGSFWTEAATYCLRAVSDGTISAECRHTDFNSYLQV